MLTGITSSPLLSNLYEGKKKTVPIGQTPLTNVLEQNDKSVYPTTLGTPLTSRTLSDFEAPGDNIQSKIVKRDDSSNQVAFDKPVITSSGNVSEIYFNEQTGNLAIIKADGSMLNVPGFLTQADFGTGKAGPRGIDGNDGFDGDDGDDAPEGDTGCMGPVGALGELGVQGNTPRDGITGPNGPIGQHGPVGMQGAVGEQGRFGHEGARGRKGLSCGTSAGAPGATPAPVNASVVISNTAPTDGSLLWGKPS